MDEAQWESLQDVNLPGGKMAIGDANASKITATSSFEFNHTRMREQSEDGRV